MPVPILLISETPVARGIPKAGGDGKLAAGWLPDLASVYAPLVHTHAAADIVSGTLDNARVNWAAPGAIGGTTANTIIGSQVDALSGSDFARLHITGGDPQLRLFNSGVIDVTLTARSSRAALNNSLTVVGGIHSTPSDGPAPNAGQILLRSAAASPQWIGFVENSIATSGSLGFRAGNTSFVLELGGSGNLNATGRDVLSITTAGLATLKATDTNTASVVNALTLDHDLSSGNGANGIGTGLLFRARSSTQLRNAARWRAALSTATDASYVSTLIGSVYNAGSEVDVLTLTPTYGLLKYTSDRNFRFTAGGSSGGRLEVVNDALNTRQRVELSGLPLMLLYDNTLVATIQSTTQFIWQDGFNLQAGTTTGTKIGTSATQKLGIWNATPIVQPSHINDPSGGGTQDSEARTAINAILDLLQATGLMAA